MPQQAIANKIPGVLPALKCDHYIQDLSKLSRVQLIEIKEREEKLMSRMPNLNRLPDKGQRIKDFYQKVCKALETLYDVDDAASRFSDMNIASRGKEKLNKMEWNGGLNGDAIDDVIDSDGEAEMDPLKIIAQRAMHEKKVTTIVPEVSLVTEEDMEEIKSFANEKTDPVVNAEIASTCMNGKIEHLKPQIQEISHSNQEDDQHLKYLVGMGVDLPATKEKFKPYQTTISNVHNPDKEKLRKHAGRWENTAATPPLIQNGPAKMLSLTDSVEIQKAYLAKMKDLQEKQAAERLAAKLQRVANLKIELPSEEQRKNNPLFSTYREPKLRQPTIEGVRYIDEDDEVHDLVDEKPGGVICTYSVFE